MAKKMEDLLRRGMQGVGQFVEKAIGKARAAKATVVAGAPSTSQPAFETSFGLSKLKEILTLANDRIVPPLLPELANKSAIEIAEGTGRFAVPLKEHGAKLVASLEIGTGVPVTNTDSTRQLYVIRGSLRRLPFADAFFDFCIANLATPHQGDFLKSLKEIGRVMAPGADLVVADYHPFGSYAKRGSARIKPVESTLRGMGDYFKVARLAGLRVRDIRESFVDETMRAAFVTPEEKIAYRTLKDNPIMVCLLLRKGSGAQDEL